MNFFKHLYLLALLISVENIDEVKAFKSKLLTKEYWQQLSHDKSILEDESNIHKYVSKGRYKLPTVLPQMKGVNRAGFEYACVQEWGMTDGPTDDSSIQAMKKWNIEIVRLPLNEDCWLRNNGVKDAFSGKNYISAVKDYTKRLINNGIKVILNLHWSSGAYTGPGWTECSEYKAMCKKPMPNAENSPKFWKSVANEFKNNDNVIFDLFNNPDPERTINYNIDLAWKCWKNGGDNCPGFQYKVAGMQDLVNAVRETGAKNFVMVAGIRNANDLSKLFEYPIRDKEGKMIISWHSWSDHKCNSETCWEAEVSRVAKLYPLIVSEIGEGGCSHSYSTKLMDWLDKKKISYLSWTWNTWDCSSGGLISDYKGTPTEYGKGLYKHLTEGKSQVNSKTEDKPKNKEKKCLKKQIRGVNRSGAEYSCVKNLGIFEGPVDENSIRNMKKWKINVVRIPLNEDCWLGINNHRADLTDKNYRDAVTNYVNNLLKQDISVILDLHWSGGYYDGAGRGECVDFVAKCQKPMPDAEYAPKFWKSVAEHFKNNDKIIFDLYNEPFPDMIYWEKSKAWKCWKEGGDSCPNFPFRVAGMQDLVDAVRQTGASNPIMVGGINWASDLSQWKQHVPNDPLNKIVASWHAYALNPCNNIDCWETMIGPIAKEYSVVVGEMGETDCTHEYIDRLMKWLDKKQISYVGWTWNTWDCGQGPALITDYNGTPTEFGKGLMNHLKNDF